MTKLVVPSEILLFRAGVNANSHGAGHEVLFDADAAANVMRSARYRTPIVASHDVRKVAGLCELHVRTGLAGPELWGARVRWESSAERSIDRGDIIGWSPSVHVDPVTRRLRSVAHIALATAGQHQPAMLHAHFEPADKEPIMPHVDFEYLSAAGVPAGVVANVRRSLRDGIDGDVAQDVLARLVDAYGGPGARLERLSNVVPFRTISQRAADEEAAGAHAAIGRELAAMARLTGVTASATELRAAHNELLADDARTPEQLAADRRDGIFATMAGVDLATFRRADAAMGSLDPAAEARMSTVTIEACLGHAGGRTEALGGDPFSDAGRRKMGLDDTDGGDDGGDDDMTAEEARAFKASLKFQPAMKRSTFVAEHRRIAAEDAAAAK
jgi:hypothetical protein